MAQTLAVIERYDDIYSAVQDGKTVSVLGPDGDTIITFFMGVGEGMTEETLRMIVSTYYVGLAQGAKNGKAQKVKEFLGVLGLQNYADKDSQ